MPRTGIRPICLCGQPVRTKGFGRTGIRLWDRRCWKCYEFGYKMHKKTYCEDCGFVAIHAVQLDVDHIDGNHTNDDLSNLRTLCANCHRLKTQLNRDHLPKRDAIVSDTGQMELMLDA